MSFERPMWWTINYGPNAEPTPANACEYEWKVVTQWNPEELRAPTVPPVVAAERPAQRRAMKFDTTEGGR